MRCLIVFSLVATFALAQELLPGRCPEFTPKEDFDVPPYLGLWYEIARFPTPDQVNTTCNYAEYSDNGDGTVGVHNAGLNADGSYNEIFGYVALTDVPGALVLHLDGVPFAGDYNVMETDYVTYTSIYSCVDFIGLGHGEQAWVLARTPTLSQEDLDTAIAAFSKWGIDTTPFVFTPQEDCSVPPAP